MDNKVCTKLIIVVLWTLLWPVSSRAEVKTHWFYYMDIGVQGGLAYYAGELSQYAFVSMSETYGAQLRFKINPRWALQAKGQRQSISGASWLHMDLVGEYNFFELGLNEYNIHMRRLTPYLFAGVGASSSKTDMAMYLPVGVGLKWKFAERWQLQLAWQHNVYVWNGDGLEGEDIGTSANNSHGMNGSNIMNNDIASTMTLGLVFEFGRKKGKCVYCQYD